MLSDVKKTGDLKKSQKKIIINFINRKLKINVKKIVIESEIMRKIRSKAGTHFLVINCFLSNVVAHRHSCAVSYNVETDRVHAA